MKITVIILIMAIIISSISIAQDTAQQPVQEATQQQSRVPATRIETLNNGQYTITYNPRDLAGIIKAEKKQTPGQTQAMLWIHSDAQNSDYGLIKSGNIQKKTIENQRGDTISLLEVSNRTVGAIFENDYVVINGTFNIKKGTRHEVTTNEGTRVIQTAYFELEREADLEINPTENEKLLVTCKQEDRTCKRIVGFGDAEELTITANWLNIRGEANITLKSTENQEAAGITVRNIAGILSIAGETESLGRAITLYGIPYLDRNPGSLLGWNKIKSEMPVSFIQTYEPNGQVLKSGMQSPTFDRINVYDTCATPNCWFTTFLSENGAPVVFFLRNSPILQLLGGKIAFVKQDRLYSGCLLEIGTTCIKSDETGNNMKISLTGNSKIKIEPPTQIRKLSFDRLIEDNSEVVVDGNGKRLIFNKQGVKYTGPEAWYSLKTSFSIREIIGGRTRLLECNAETRKCLVDGQETLSPELKSCTSNDECGPEEKCSDNICVFEQACISIKGGDNNPENLDLLVIIPDRNNEDIKIDVKNWLFSSGSMFATAPFNNNADRFNIWVLGTEGQSRIGSFSTKQDIQNNWKRSCPSADYLLAIGIFDYSVAYKNRKEAFVAIRDSNSFMPNLIGGTEGYLKRVITHELGGHAIGRLGDEYTRDSNFRPYEPVGPSCARNREEAVRKFGTQLAEQSIRQNWIGCGGDCQWERYGCDGWFTVSETETEDLPAGLTTRTKTIMGSSVWYDQFSPFDQQLIENEVGII